MVHDSGMCISGKKWIKMRMKTPIHLNSKGNEVIVWCSFIIWSCLFLNSHYPYMCYHRRCLLHHISARRVNNDNIHQGLEAILVIRISICCQVWWMKRWEASLWTCVPLFKVIAMTIFQSVLWATICSFLVGH
jgi:hypothetical protein